MERKPRYYIVRREGQEDHIEHLDPPARVGGRPHEGVIRPEADGRERGAEILGGPFTMAEIIAALGMYYPDRMIQEPRGNIPRPEGAKPLQIKPPPAVTGKPVEPWAQRKAEMAAGTLPSGTC